MVRDVHTLTSRGGAVADRSMTCETPDFQAMALRLSLKIGCDDAPDAMPLIAEALCMAWNDRGHTDLAAVTDQLTRIMGAPARLYVAGLERALNSLDCDAAALATEGPDR